MALGVLLVVWAGLCFSSLPYRLFEWLGTDPRQLKDAPEFIVVLGGGGVPSESGLVRAYGGARAARLFPDSKLIVAIPEDHASPTSALSLMKQELMLRGVAPERIMAEKKGCNTRAQALNVLAMLGDKAADRRVLVITSPDHLKRAMLCFRKAGFKNAHGEGIYNESIEGDMVYQDKDLGGNRIPALNIGSMLLLRYEFWNNHGYLGRVLRELTAIAYYKLRGWA
jgi:uncharacterized SAM-binding protein YcdF (DUF218 family)